MNQTPFHQMQNLESQLTSFQDRLQELLENLDRNGEANLSGRQAKQVLRQLEEAETLAEGILPVLHDLREDFSAIRTEQQRLSTLFEVSQLVNSTLQLEDLLQIVIDRAISVIEAERGFLMLRDEASGQLHFAVARHMRREDIEESSFQVSRSIVNRVAESAEPVLTDNASEDPRFADSVSIATYVLRSILCVPLVVKNRVIGVLYVDNRVRIGHFTPDDLSLLTAFANQAAVAIENARLFEHVVVLDRLKGDFLESVSHELRSPLTSLSAGVELLTRSMEEENPDLANLVRESLGRLTGVVRRLTRFSEIEQDGRTIVGVEESQRRLPLRELLAEVVAAYKERAEEKELVLNLVVEGEIVSLEVPQGVIRALTEVLDNAVSYTEKGVIFITARRAGQELLISVADTGIGIPSDEMPYVFDKLFRGRKVRSLSRTQGLGLGLSVARWVARSYGGRIWAESVEGKGSVFSLAFPLERVDGKWCVVVPTAEEAAPASAA